MKKGKKIIASVLVLGAVGASLYAAWSNDMLPFEIAAEETEAALSYKEVTVQRGNLITGVEESGSVSIGYVTQTCELTADSETSSSSSSSMSGSTGMNMAMGMSMSGSSSQNSSNQSSSSEVSLIVEEVYAATGQRVKESEALIKISEESIDAYRASLETVVSSAKLAVVQAQITRDENALNSEYDYQTNLANGEVAQDEYDNTIAGLENQITEIQTSINKSLETITELTEDLSSGEDVEDELEEEQENYANLCTQLLTAQNNLITGTITAKQKYDLAMLNYEYADSLYEIDTDGLDTDLESALDSLEAAQEELEAFEAFIGDGIIISEYSGVVTEVGFAQGDALTDGGTVASFQNTDDVTISVSVNQEDISRVAVGNRVVIELNAYTDTQFEGKVQSISTSATSGSSTVDYVVTVLFTGDVTKVYADMTGSVTFVEEEVSDVLYVSKRSIIEEGKTSYVKVLEDDGTIRKQEVETGFSDGYQIEIVSGLEEGQTVIIESQVK